MYVFGRYPTCVGSTWSNPMRQRANPESDESHWKHVPGYRSRVETRAAENAAEKSTEARLGRVSVCLLHGGKSRLVSEVKQAQALGRSVVAEGGGRSERWSRQNDTLWMWGLEGHVNTDGLPPSTLLCGCRDLLLLLRDLTYIRKSFFNLGQRVTTDL